jgi:hypothetical protein
MESDADSLVQVEDADKPAAVYSPNSSRKPCHWLVGLTIERVSDLVVYLVRE